MIGLLTVQPKNQLTHFEIEDNEREKRKITAERIPTRLGENLQVAIRPARSGHSDWR
jgi:hypothetical protein